MQYLRDGHSLGVGQRLCYRYWENKKQLFWNMKEFREHVTISNVRSHFLMEKVVENGYFGDGDECSVEEMTVVKAFHFVNTAMLFPNVEIIEIQQIDLCRFLCDALLELVTLLEDESAEIKCGRKLKRVQLCGADDDDRLYLEFMEEDLERYAEHFEQLNWSFDASRTG